MNKYIIASGLLALMAAATSCDKYDLYPEDFDGIFTIRDSGTKDLVLWSTDESKEVPFIVMKGGYDPEVTSTATLKVMNAAEFQQYNENLGTLPYILVGDECYSFSANPGENVYTQDYVFDSADKKAETAKLYVRPRLIDQWLTDHADEIAVGDLSPVIPVTLVSETDSVNSYGNVTLLKVEVRKPELAADLTGSVSSSTVNLQNYADGDEITFTPDINYSMPCENPWGFTLNFVADPEIVEDYNYDHGTSYVALDPSHYDFEPSYEFAPGTNYMTLKLTLKLNGLKAQKKPYAVGIMLDPENPIVWSDPDNNPGEALALDKGKIMIFTVRLVDNKNLEKINLSTANVVTYDQEASEGPLASLFDGDVSTFYHSNWHAGSNHDPIYGSYLDITLPNEMSSFRFDVTVRHNNNNGRPKTVYLFGTNDPANWPTTPFAQITEMTEQLTTAGTTGNFGSDEEPFGDGTAYKYIRFSVIESALGDLTQTNTAAWSAAELVLYGY